MKKRKLLITILLLLVIFPFAVAKASDLETGNNISIAKGEIISGNFFAAGSEITIDGVITGDLIAAAEKITINGELGGDLIAAASKIEINGLIGGNIRVAASEISLNGEVRRNATIAAEKISFAKGSILFWDLMSISDELFLDGDIKGRVDTIAENIGLNGQIEKDMAIKLEGKNETLIISPEAEIKGDLSYSKDDNSFISNQGKIGGKTSFSEKIKKSNFSFQTFALGRIMAILAAFLSVVALYFGLGKHWQGIVKATSTTPLKNLLHGALIFFASPFAIIICALTIIGFPLALSLAAICAAIFYLFKIFSAIFLGELIFKKITKKPASKLAVIASGIIISWLIFSIPFVGPVFAFAAASLGLGGVIKYVKN